MSLFQAYKESEQEFDKNYPNEIREPHDSGWTFGPPSPYSIKSFLSQHTAKFLEAVLEEMPEEKKLPHIECATGQKELCEQCWYYTNYNNGLSASRKPIEEFLKTLKE